MTDAKQASAPGTGTEDGADTKSFGGDKVHDSTTVASATITAATIPTAGTVPDWGAAMSCSMACGWRHCPYECPAVIGGAL